MAPDDRLRDIPVRPTYSKGQVRGCPVRFPGLRKCFLRTGPALRTLKTTPDGEADMRMNAVLHLRILFVGAEETRTRAIARLKEA